MLLLECQITGCKWDILNVRWMLFVVLTSEYNRGRYTLMTKLHCLLESQHPAHEKQMGDCDGDDIISRMDFSLWEPPGVCERQRYLNSHVSNLRQNLTLCVNPSQCGEMAELEGRAPVINTLPHLCLHWIRICET